MPVFEKSVELVCTPEEVFDFLIRTDNMQRISPPQMGLQFTNAPDVVESGSRMEFKIQGYGVVQHVVHEVVTVRRPRQFTEKQVEGPLKLWLHDHLFEPTGSDQVTVVDRIEFEPPGGLVGYLVTADKIAESLEIGFHHRHQQLKRIMEQAGD